MLRNLSILTFKFTLLGPLILSGTQVFADTFVENAMNGSCGEAPVYVERTINYGSSYTFENTTTNNRDIGDIGLNSVSVSYIERRDLNGSNIFPSFIWTDAFTKQNFILKPHESAAAITANSAYEVKFIPEEKHVGDGEPDLFLIYSISYYVQEEGGWGDLVTEISSCIGYDVVLE